MQPLPAHIDRLITTLAQRSRLLQEAGPGPYAEPDEGSADARVNQKLLAHRVRTALATTTNSQAMERLAGLDSSDLWAGTVQDGTARGFMVALEETLSLCQHESDTNKDFESSENALTDAKQLRRKRDILIASAGTRMRFSRKRGVHLIDRRHDFNEENCIQFEDRTDCGDLDRFVADGKTRPRIFSPGFLTPTCLIQEERRDLLELRGRLGRRSNGFPCELTFEGRKDEDFLRMTLRIENRQENHRLRIRFLGISDASVIHSEGTPGWETVHYRGRVFAAATLVRACGHLRVDENSLATPDAQCLGWIEHRFKLLV